MRNKEKKWKMNNTKEKVGAESILQRKGPTKIKGSGSALLKGSAKEGTCALEQLAGAAVFETH